MPDPEPRTWTCLRNKLRDPCLIRTPGYCGFSIDFRNSYYGPWMWINLGWFVLLTGRPDPLVGDVMW